MRFGELFKGPGANKPVDVGHDAIEQDLLATLRNTFADGDFTREEAEAAYAKNHGVNPANLRASEILKIGRALSLLSHSSRGLLLDIGGRYLINPPRNKQH